MTRRNIAGTPAGPGGLSLLVRFEQDKAVIVRSSVSSSPPDPGGVSEPVLRAVKSGTPPAGTPGVVAWFLGPRGEVKASHGWSGQGHAFFDRAGASARGSAGGSRGLSPCLPAHAKILHLPVPADADHLLFSRTEVGAQEVGPEAAGTRAAVRGPALQQRPLALYALRQRQGIGAQALTALPFPGELPQPSPWPLPVTLPSPAPALASARALAPRAGAGYIDSHATLIKRGAPSNRFDIVIMGDGFTKKDLPRFDGRARRIADGLLAMAPFKKVASLINVHVVRAVSRDSGITKCPTGTGRKNTYFGVEGNWKNAGYAGYLCTPYPERVYDAAELIAPIDQIELMIVIANCGGSGGSGFPDMKMVFLTEDSREIDLAAHEAARYENQVTEAQVQAGHVWWKLLAKRTELQGERFKAVDTPEKRVPPRHGKMLGLFWGCQNIDLPSGAKCDPNVDPWTDPRGRHFYRAMERCKMRDLREPFCRVCSAVLERTIKAAAIAPAAKKVVSRVVRRPLERPLHLGGEAARPRRPVHVRGREV